MRRHLPFIAGLLLVAAGIVLLEWLDPFAFVHDDNANQFLPIMIEGMRQLTSGHIPYLNPFQFTGAPLLEVGTYPLLYPVTLIAYAAARACGDERLLFEFFVGIHALGGFACAFALLRKHGVAPAIAMLAAVSFALGGFGLIASRGWFYIAPTITFLPLLLVCDTMLARKPSARTALWIGVLRGIYAMSGNTQFFIYTCIVETAYLLLVSRDRGRISAHHLLSLLVSAIVALPMLLPMLQMLGASSRGDGVFFYARTGASNPWDVVRGSLLPYPIVHGVTNFGMSGGAFIAIYFTNTVLAALFFWYGTRRLASGDAWRNPAQHAFLWIGLGAMLLSFGYFGIVYLLLAGIPIWNGMHHAFKLTLYVNLCMIVFGAISLQHVVRTYPRIARSLLACMALLTFASLMLHLLTASSVAPSYTVVPPLDSNLAQEGRYLPVLGSSIRENSTTRPSFDVPQRLGGNAATLAGIDNLRGYEPFDTWFAKAILTEDLWDVPVVFDAHEVILRPRVWTPAYLPERFAAYGVAWAVVPHEVYPFVPALAGQPIAYTDARYRFDVVRIADPAPFVSDGDGAALTAAQARNGDLRFSTRAGGTVTVNRIWREAYRAHSDGVRIPIAHDAYGRITLDVPPGAHEVTLTYRRPSFWIGLGVAAMVLAVLVCTRLPERIVGLLTPWCAWCLRMLRAHWKAALAVFLLVSAAVVGMNVQRTIGIDGVQACIVQGWDAHPIKPVGIIYACSEADRAQDLHEMCAGLYARGIRHTLYYDIGPDGCVPAAS